MYWKDTPDSDLFTRDVQTAVNKNYSRENGTKVKRAYRTKAEAGWFPYRHTPMGYRHLKLKDNYGNAIKGTATITVDPNVEHVRLVQREFELRAQGFSYDSIRKMIMDEGLVPNAKRLSYSRSSIEKRMKNQLYWGTFQLTGDTTVYQGRHELIIPQNILSAVKLVNEGHSCTKSNLAVGGEDLFRDWMTCGHPECQRRITYERKRKELKSGETKIYHLYRCSNSRKIHSKKQYIQENKIWDQLEPAVSALSISQELANDISKALNETHEKQKAAIKKQMEGFRIERDSLREERDRAVILFVSGKLRELEYSQFIGDIDRKDDHFANELERLSLQISDESMVSVQKVFELAINAEKLFKSMSKQNRLAYLKKVCSNPTLDGLTVRFQLQKPFERLSNWKENQEWRRG